MKTHIRIAIVTVATTVLGLGTVVAASADATSFATAAATGLQTSRLYIDPAIAANSGLNSGDAQALASELAAQSPPIYIVFEPEAAVPNVKNGYDAFPTMVGQISSTLAEDWYMASADGVSSEARSERLLRAIYLLLRAQILAEGNSWDPQVSKGYERL